MDTGSISKIMEELARNRIILTSGSLGYNSFEHLYLALGGKPKS